jgi:hypothetical protein
MSVLTIRRFIWSEDVPVTYCTTGPFKHSGCYLPPGECGALLYPSLKRFRLNYERWLRMREAF